MATETPDILPPEGDLWAILQSLDYTKPGATRFVGPYYDADNIPDSEFPHERGVLSAAYADALGFVDLQAEATGLP